MPDIRPSLSRNCDFEVGTIWRTLSGYALVFALDGDLVLMSPTRLRLWHSDTRGRGGRILSMQVDGNLAIYDESRRITLWATKTTGHRDAFLSVQEDGNVVIYTNSGVPIWATGTACARAAETPPQAHIPHKPGALSYR